MQIFLSHLPQVTLSGRIGKVVASYAAVALIYTIHVASLPSPCENLPCSGGSHMERGGMPLHDAVGINCKKGATTEHQDSAVEYMG